MSSRVARSDRGNSTWTSFLSLSGPLTMWMMVIRPHRCPIISHAYLTGPHLTRAGKKRTVKHLPTTQTTLWRGCTFNKVLITKLLKI